MFFREPVLALGAMGIELRALRWRAARGMPFDAQGEWGPFRGGWRWRESQWYGVEVVRQAA